MSNLTNRIIAYENGELSFDSALELFQDLIDMDLVWSLQGNYGRTAQALINEGYCYA